MRYVALVLMGVGIVIVTDMIEDSDWAVKARADMVAKDANAKGDPWEVRIARYVAAAAVAVAMIFVARKLLKVNPVAVAGASA